MNLEASKPIDLPAPQEARTPMLEHALPLKTAMAPDAASAAVASAPPPATTTAPAAGQPLFVGRRRELDLLYGHVAGPQRGHVAVSGPLGIGKTRLLHQLADPLMAASYGLDVNRYLFITLDLQSVTPFSGVRFWRRVAWLTQRQRPRPRLQAATDALLCRPDLDIVDIEELLDAAAAEDHVLVLLLDEMEWALQADDAVAAAACRDFLAQTASLARRSPRTLVLVTASVNPLHQATREVEGWRGSPFATVFTALPLGPLDATAAAAFLELALVRAGLPQGALALGPILELAAGQPAALEAAALSLHQRRGPSVDAVALGRAALDAAGEALEHLATLTSPREPQRPSARPAAPAAPSARGLWMDPTGGEVLVNGRRVEAMTSLEYSLLRLLYSQPGRVCTKEDIVRHVWGAEHRHEDAVVAVEEARVEKLVSRLRHKIEPVPGRPQILRTVRGRGYRYVPAG